MEGRKIPSQYENPIDDKLIALAEYLNPFFYRWGFNPNGITFLSLLTGLLSNYLFYEQWWCLAGFFYFVSYFFDCMDGNFARKYNMCTAFGDMFDHVKDFTVALLFFPMFLTWTAIPFWYKMYTTLTFGLLMIGSAQFLACQEEIYSKSPKSKGNESLFLKICTMPFNWGSNTPPETRIQWLKYASTGTGCAFLSLHIACIGLMLQPFP
eukprot:GDKI01041606.1.p1 GENE.GDKI01041606.1~~GDKI01041606.1.p1  ORF type:complete len:209 (-),score=42.67 GDKI01041606.1:26-652(-)